MQHAHHFWLDSSELMYLIVRSSNAGQEDEVGDEEADAEVQVDGGAGALDGADEAKGQHADEEADQRQEEAHPRDQLQFKHILWQERKR